MDAKGNGRLKPSQRNAKVGFINEEREHRRGILTDAEIRDRMLMDISLPSSIVITPFIDDDDDSPFDTDSIDLRLGTHFLFPRVPPRAYYCPDANSRNSFHMKVHVPIGDFLVVPPHSTVLGQTLEFIKLPFDVSGEILTKSSVARTFTLIETAPWIHPSYRGCLTLEIANVSNTAILLYPGRRIGQMVLLHVAIPKTKELLYAEAPMDDNYFGPIYPGAPLFKDPEDDLKRIGVTNTRIVSDPEWAETPAGMLLALAKKYRQRSSLPPRLNRLFRDLSSSLR